MVDAIQQVYVELYGGHDRDSTDPAQFAPPAGLFLVGYLGDMPVASGGWRRSESVKTAANTPESTLGDTAEIKRMYVAGSVRRKGLARRMLAELESTAAWAGVRRMVLNTGYRQPDAIALYESSGYERTVARFGHYADIDGTIFFAKLL